MTLEIADSSELGRVWFQADAELFGMNIEKATLKVAQLVLHLAVLARETRRRRRNRHIHRRPNRRHRNFASLLRPISSSFAY